MSKFKVGDKVKIVGNSNPMHHFAIGDVVEVASLSGFDVYGEIELRGHCAWQEPGETETQYLSLSDIEPVTPTTTFTIGQTYKTAGDRTVTCIALREDGGMFGVFGEGGTVAYGWDKEGNYLCAPAPDCGKYKINLGPVRETVTVEGSFHLCGDGKHKTLHHDLGDNKFTMTIDKVDGKFDWTTAKVTRCA